MPSSFNRCSALAGREPSRVTIGSFKFVFIYLSPIAKQPMSVQLTLEGCPVQASLGRGLSASDPTWHEQFLSSCSCCQPYNRYSAVDGKHVPVRRASGTQDLWPPFDRGRK